MTGLGLMTGLGNLSLSGVPLLDTGGAGLLTRPYADNDTNAWCEPAPLLGGLDVLKVAHSEDAGGQPFGDDFGVNHKLERHPE